MNLKWFTLCYLSFLLCFSYLIRIQTPPSSSHVSYSFGFITGHFAVHFPVFILFDFSLALMGWPTISSLLETCSQKKTFGLGSFPNLLGIASQAWVDLSFHALLKYYSFPSSRVQWSVFSWIRSWVFIFSHPQTLSVNPCLLTASTATERNVDFLKKKKKKSKFQAQNSFLGHLGQGGVL